jgi:hypothetical protein
MNVAHIAHILCMYPPPSFEPFPSYGRHFSRELEKTLNQFERRQRMRKGQQLPPQVAVKIS